MTIPLSGVVGGGGLGYRDRTDPPSSRLPPSLHELWRTSRRGKGKQRTEREGTDMADDDDELRNYDVTACAVADLNEEDRAACVAIIKSGEAVDPESAEAELPRASVVAVARRAKQIVGVGAIKRIRLGYASDKAYKSGVTFAPDTPELGYVAVDPAHQGKGLSHRIVAALLSKNGGPLFATTSSEGMKKTLVKAGFAQKGREWKGQKGQLSLWMRE